MDYLDPRKNRKYHLRLRIGYGLFAIAILLVTYLIHIYLQGNSYDVKTHSIVQTGILFVDSKPGGANIDLNGISYGTTAARLVLPASPYKLTVSKDGYRSWERNIDVEPSSLDYFVYPFLFPKTPVSTAMQSFTSQPQLITQSPDQHWLLVELPATSTDILSFAMFDTTKPDVKPVTINIPNAILGDPAVTGSTFSLVEWSTDNDHLLLQHNYQGGSEFLIIDRTDPSTSINVNQMFSINPSEVALRNKSVNQIYIYDQANQTLQVADTTKQTIDPVFLKNVLAFKPYGTSLLTYVTDNNQPKGMVQARIWNNGNTYPLYNFTAGRHYLIDAAQYQGHWYYIAGSDTDDRINIFQDPLSTLEDNSIAKAYPTIAIRVSGATKVSFSKNARFVAVENGQSFGVYDFETQDRYQYSLSDPLTGPLVWMDGARLIGQTAGSVFVTDYDGTNQQKVVSTAQTDGGYFSSNFNQFYTLQPGSDPGTYKLTDVDMRAGTDLPKTANS